MNTIVKWIFIAMLLVGCGAGGIRTAQEVKDSYRVVTYIDSEHSNICYMYVSDLASSVNKPVSISCLPLRGGR